MGLAMKRSSNVSDLTVDDLLITSELETRAKQMRHRRGLETGAALQELSEQIGDDPEDVLPRFVELARQLCGAARQVLQHHHRLNA